ncbi:MAG: hypothetical protein R3F37_16885 [Candidatus Competibacteraceae bacterium]
MAESIDSDLNTLSTLAGWFTACCFGGYGPGDMLEEVRDMLHREVDYRTELEKYVRVLVMNSQRLPLLCTGCGFPNIPARVLTSS